MQQIEQVEHESESIPEPLDAIDAEARAIERHVRANYSRGEEWTYLLGAMHRIRLHVARERERNDRGEPLTPIERMLVAIYDLREEVREALEKRDEPLHPPTEYESSAFEECNRILNDVREALGAASGQNVVTLAHATRNTLSRTRAILGASSDETAIDAATRVVDAYNGESKTLVRVIEERDAARAELENVKRGAIEVVRSHRRAATLEGPSDALDRVIEALDGYTIEQLARKAK